MKCAAVSLFLLWESSPYKEKRSAVDAHLDNACITVYTVNIQEEVI